MHSSPSFCFGRTFDVCQGSFSAVGAAVREFGVGAGTAECGFSTISGEEAPEPPHVRVWEDL